MPQIMATTAIYLMAAVAEIAGCFAFWAWLRHGQNGLWVLPGLVSLGVFAWLLTLAPSDQAGRAYAAYGGVYIASSIAWLWLVEQRRPDTWELIGGAMAIAAAAVILFGPREAQ